MVLVPEPIVTVVNETIVELKNRSVQEMIGVGGIVAIAVSCLVFVVCSLFVIWRYCKQRNIARLQLQKETELNVHEQELTVREQELKSQLEALEQERDALVHHTQGMSRERDVLTKQAKEAELVLENSKAEDMNVQSLQVFEKDIDTENQTKIDALQQELHQKHEGILQQLLQAGENVSVTLPPPPPPVLLSGEEGDQDELNDTINELVLNANMDQALLQKHLDQRRDKIVQRTFVSV